MKATLTGMGHQWQRCLSGGVLALVLAGCYSTPGGAGTGGPSEAAAELVAHQPDVSAIVVVVGDAYAQAGAAKTLFLGAEPGAVEPLGFPQARDRLTTELQVPIQSSSERVFADLVTPVDSASGEAALSITLGRFSIDSRGHLRVKVSFAPPAMRHGCLEYDLAPNDAGWSIVATKPGCVPGAGAYEDYDSALERQRSGRCTGLWASAGTCGDWLYTLETSGYGGYKAYYDSETREIVALEGFTDHGPQFDWFVFGDADCEMEHPDETASCGG